MFPDSGGVEELDNSLGICFPRSILTAHSNTSNCRESLGSALVWDSFSTGMRPNYFFVDPLEAKDRVEYSHASS
jgi:hypothetical protein